MTEMRNAIIFVEFWRPPNDPPPPEATILNYLTDRKRGGGRALPFVGFWRPPMPQYLTNLMTERGDAIIFCRILAPPPSPDATNLTILMTGRRGGRQYPVKS